MDYKICFLCLTLGPSDLLSLTRKVPRGGWMCPQAGKGYEKPSESALDPCWELEGPRYWCYVMGLCASQGESYLPQDCDLWEVSQVGLQKAMLFGCLSRDAARLCPCLNCIYRASFLRNKVSKMWINWEEFSEALTKRVARNYSVNICWCHKRYIWNAWFVAEKPL